MVFIVSNPPFIGLIGPLLKIVRRLRYLFLFIAGENTNKVSKSLRKFKLVLFF